MPGKENLIASVTGYAQVRVHDTNGQRRPIFHVTLGEKAFNCISATPDGKYLLLGDIIGNINKFDITARKSAGLFKGKVRFLSDSFCFSQEGTNFSPFRLLVL